MSDYAEFGKAERDGWSEPGTAASYADGFASAAEHCVAPIVSAAGVAVGSTALDVCCGQGIVAAGLAATGAAVTGLDFSPAMLDIARQRVPGVIFREGDARSLPFEAGSFDAVTMGFGMLHIPEPETAIAEVRRVLKPGGRFVYSVWHAPDQSAAFRIVFGAIAAHGDPAVTLPPGPPIHAFADPEIAFAALGAAGFTGAKLETADAYWVVDDPGRPFDHFLGGTVRGALLLRSQPKAHAAAIRAAVADQVRTEFGSRPPWRVPIPAAAVSAVAG